MQPVKGCVGADDYADFVPRLRRLKRDDLDDAGLQVWNSLVGSRGDSVLDDDGALAGPFNAMVHSPETGRHLADLGAALRYRSALDQRLIELAVIMVGARWRAEYEWFSHAPLAIAAGVAPQVVESIRVGESVRFANVDERIVYDLVSELLSRGRVSESAYSEAVTCLGEPGVIDLVNLCGYYTLISFSLNTFAVPLPPGATPVWP